MAKVFTLAGLVVALGGALVLYVYAVPHRKFGPLLVFGPLGFRIDEPPATDPESKDSYARAGKYIDGARRLSQLGFGLIALGTLLQLLGAVLAQ